MTDEVNKTRSKTRGLKPPFEPGNPGGPGRPKGSLSLKSILKKKLAECPLPDVDKRTYGEQVIARVIKDAMSGNTQAQRMCLEYIDGKPDNAIQEVVMSAQVEHSDLSDRLALYEQEFRELETKGEVK